MSINFEPGSKISLFYSQEVFIVLWADFLCQQYSEVTIKPGRGQEKPLTGALSGWKSSKETLPSTSPPLLHPCAFVSTFLTCFFSHLSFISHISVQTLVHVTSLDTYLKHLSSKWGLGAGCCLHKASSQGQTDILPPRVLVKLCSVAPWSP